MNRAHKIKTQTNKPLFAKPHKPWHTHYTGHISDLQAHRTQRHTHTSKRESSLQATCLRGRSSCRERERRTDCPAAFWTREHAHRNARATHAAWQSAWRHDDLDFKLLGIVVEAHRVATTCGRCPPMPAAAAAAAAAAALLSRA